MPSPSVAATASETGGNAFTRTQWAAMCIVVCSGFTSQMVMPLWVGAVIDDLHLDAAAAGRIGAMEFFAVAVVSLTIALVMRRLPIRPVVIAGVTLLVLGNLGSALVHNEVALTAMRMLCGLGKGLVVAIIFSLAAGSDRPTRAFALLNICYAICASIFYMVLPFAITHGGASGAFLTMAAAAVIGACMMPFFPTQRAGMVMQEIPKISSLPRWGLLAFVALVMLWSGHNALWTFIERVGHEAGLSLQGIGAILSLSAIITIAGPSAVGIVDTRFGYTAPMLIAIAAKIAAVILLVTMLDASVFTVAVPAFLFLSLFITPYVMGLLSLADPAGRLAAASSAAMTAGASSGAFLGGLALSKGGMHGIGAVAVGQFILFTILILVAASAARRAS